MPVNLSYPKPRSVLTKVIEIARTDNATEKCVLPKDAVVCDIHVYQSVAATTDVGTFDLGWSGDADALLNDFTMATTAVGLVNAGTAIGASFLTKLTADRAIISTYTVGSSTAGGTGYVVIDYFVPGPGETL